MTSLRASATIIVLPLPRELRAFLDVGPGGVRGKEAEGWARDVCDQQ